MLYSESSSSEYTDSENNNEEWQECVCDRNYEISSKYPHEIRRKGTTRNIKRNLKTNGYYRCCLNGKEFLHHRIVALQFIKNDDPTKTEVDHINHNRSDNRISNLRWVNHMENMKNTGGYAGISFVYTDEIDDESIEIRNYGNRELENYFYDFNIDQFYHKENNKYRLLNVIHCKDGNEILNLYDKNHTRFKFSVKKFLADYELI